MRRRRRTTQEDNFWPSFTDMISTIALILFFLMLIAYINNIITGKNLEYAKKQLVDTELSLEESKAEISQAEDQLRLLVDDLDKTMAELRIGEIALKVGFADDRSFRRSFQRWHQCTPNHYRKQS